MSCCFSSTSPAGPAPPTEQNLFRNPFGAKSPHHIPIGDAAIYGSATDPITVSWNQRAMGAVRSNTGNGINIYETTLAMATKTVTAKSGSFGTFPVTLHMPSLVRNPEDTSIAEGSDAVIMLLEPDGFTMHEFYQWSWNGGSPTALGHRSFDARNANNALNAGVLTRYGVSASGLSCLFGLHRGHEYTEGLVINHVIQITLSSASPSQIANSFVFPAGFTDGFCSQAGQCTGAVPYGYRFGLPPSVVISNLRTPGGILFNTLQRAFATAAYQFGWIPIDTTSGTGNNSRADQYLTSSQVTQIQDAMTTLKPLMRPITNGAEGQTAWGGGSPLSPNTAWNAQPSPALLDSRLIGIFIGNTPPDVTTFEQWFGKPVGGVLAYGDHSGWTAFDNSIPYEVGLWNSISRRALWSVPLTVSGTPLSQVSAGQFNTHFRNAAIAINGYRPNDQFVYVRTGWEFNGDWFPWAAAGKTADFIGAWRQFVQTFRSVSSRFIFDWCPNIGTGFMRSADGYPGDDVVDIIGIDAYYNITYDNPDGNSAFQYKRDQTDGFQWQKDFGITHRKPLAFSEWGINLDSPSYIQNIYDWYSSNNTIYQTYWNSDSDFRGLLSHYPNAQAKYKQLFSQW